MPRDFLSGLIGRAFEQVPVLEKRRPSMFEPERDRTGPSGEWSERVEEASTPNRWPTAREPQAVEDWKQQARQTRAVQPSLEQEQSRTEPTASQPAKIAAPLAPETARLSEEKADRGERAGMEQNSTSVRIERTIERHLETRHSVIERHEVQVERAQTPEPTKDRTSRSPLREVIHVREEAARPLQQNPLSNVPPMRPESKRADALMSPSAARTPLRARTAPVAPAPEPVPTIQVTIGRVELRSPQPSSTTKPSNARARTPKLGLDAYLRQREGGVQ